MIATESGVPSADLAHTVSGHKRPRTDAVGKAIKKHLNVLLLVDVQVHVC